MAAKSRLYLFEEEKISRAICSLCIPTVCSNLVTILYSLADTFFVGLLNNPVQTAAVSLAAPVLLAFNAINNLFGVGSSSLMSRALGAHDLKTLHKASAFGFYGALFCSVLFALACFFFQNPLLILLGVSEQTMDVTRQYLMYTVWIGASFAIINVVMAYLVRAEGNTLHASIGTMTGCILNIILDPFFILPQFLNMGAAGAALATMLSNAAACLYFFLYLIVKRKSTYVSVSWKDFSLEKAVVSEVCTVGIPASIQNLLNVAGQMIMNNLAAGFGTVAVAAMGIASRASTVGFYIAMGISQGVMPLIGYCYAAKNQTRFKEAISFTMKTDLIILTIFAALYTLFPSLIMNLFIDDTQTVAVGSVLIRGLGLAIPFLALDFLAVGVFQAVGLGKNSLLMALARKLVLEIPFMFLFCRMFGLYALGYTQLAAEMIMTALAMSMLHSFIKNWDLSLAYGEE